MKENPGSASITRFIWVLLIVSGLLIGCQSNPSLVEDPALVNLALIPEGMSVDEAATLASLEQVDDFPLYSMTYYAEYGNTEEGLGIGPDYQAQADWACSLFAVFADPENMLFGRNFDWNFSPGLLLFTDPDDGYASVSMVDIHYLGFGNDRAYGLADLPLGDLEDLLAAPYLPFDGLNEAGLAVGFAAVPDGGMEIDPAKETIDSLMVVRKILDGAATIEEAEQIIRTYNIDWGGGPPLHYLVADQTGRSVLIEFSRGEIVVIENQNSWQQATNFLVSEASSEPANHCWRYGLITEKLENNSGIIDGEEAMILLEDVAQANTQWSVVYRISAGEVRIVMGRNFTEVHHFPFQVDR